MIAAFYGYVFPNNHEAVFGVYFVFEAIGWIASLTYSVYLTTFTKLVILLSSLGVSAVGYYAAEVVHRHQLQHSKTMI